VVRLANSDVDKPLKLAEVEAIVRAGQGRFLRAWSAYFG
jgi:hypothetical protein